MSAWWQDLTGRTSIPRRLTVLMMTTATVALLIAAAAFALNDLLTLRKTLIDAQASIARIVGMNSVAAIDFDDRAAARETLASLGTQDDIVAAALYDARGQLFATYVHPAAPADAQRLPDEPATPGERFGPDHLETTWLIRQDETIVGTVFLRSDLTVWQQRLSRYLIIVLVVLIVSTGVSLAISARLQRMISKPILALAGLARRVSEERDYALRGERQSSDELGTLVSDFNLMLEQIQRRDEMLKEHQNTLEVQVEARTADLKQLTNELEYQARHDLLTGLQNRLVFEDRLGQAVARQQRMGGVIAVLFMDLERFKLVNDSLGHHHGDELLRRVAARLKENVRDMDTAARLGGDEFTVLLPELASPEDAAVVARKILDALKPVFDIGGHPIHLTASIGISVCPSDGNDVASLLRNADAAMYSAKAEGGNDFRFFSMGMNVGGTERLSMESELRRALEDGELEVHYQPQVDTASGGIMSFEALVRWRHPSWGMVLPSRFIPLAEEIGLIADIDEWVLGEALAAVARWNEIGFDDVGVSVNLSSREFARPQFVERVRERLVRSGCRPSSLELEITEGTVMHATDRVLQTLHGLKRIGILVAIDDFGTGYSSLSYLKRFPLDKLKIDQSFIRDIPHDQDDIAITRAIVAMAHSLGLTVIAEGVETTEQLAFLCDLGCDQIQGNLYSAAVPAEQVEELLASWHRRQPANFSRQAKPH